MSATKVKVTSASVADQVHLKDEANVKGLATKHLGSNPSLGNADALVTGISTHSGQDCVVAHGCKKNVRFVGTSQKHTSALHQFDLPLYIWFSVLGAYQGEKVPVNDIPADGLDSVQKTIPLFGANESPLQRSSYMDTRDHLVDTMDFNAVNSSYSISTMHTNEKGLSVDTMDHDAVVQSDTLEARDDQVHCIEYQRCSVQKGVGYGAVPFS